MTPHLLIASSSGIGGLFTALGLNLQALILNTLAFLITVYLLGRWVYPPLTKALDAKKDELEAAVRLEAEATKTLSKARLEGEEMITKARLAADEVLATAKAQASEQISNARLKAQEQGDRLIAEAHEQLARDILVAKKELKAETANLVLSATEAILGEKLDSERDQALIARTVGAK